MPVAASGPGRTAAAPGPRRLWPLAAGVLAAHLLLLGSLAPDRTVPEPQARYPFAMRPLSAPVPAAATPASPVPPVPAAPVAARPALAGPPAAAAALPTAPAPPEDGSQPAPKSLPQREPAGLPPERQHAAADATPAASATAAPSQVAPARVEVTVRAAPTELPSGHRAGEHLPALPPHAVQLPAPGRMRFAVQARWRGLTLTGEAQLSWKHEAGRYQARLEVSAPLLPTRIQTSAGTLTSQGLQPQRFSEKLRSEAATHFQRDKGKVSFSNNRPESELLPGAQDRLSVLLQLAAMVAGEPARYRRGSEIEIPTAGIRDFEPWVFSVEGEEELDLPGGRTLALKIQRVPRREYDVKLELWLAPSRGHAPVRLRLTNPNGDNVDQRWIATDPP